VSWDPAHDDRAEANRTRKALAIAEYAWHRGLDPAHLDGMDQALLRRLARAAGVSPPNRDATGGYPTWETVRSGLARWQRERPDPRTETHEHQDWCSCCPREDTSTCASPVSSSPEVSSPAVAGDFVRPPVSPARRAGATAPDPDQVWVPTGWETLRQLAPIDPERLRCFRCDGPAVILSISLAGDTRGRCCWCPPQPGEWGADLNWVLSPCQRPLRCYCGRHEVDAAVGSPAPQGCPAPV